MKTDAPSVASARRGYLAFEGYLDALVEDLKHLGARQDQIEILGDLVLGPQVSRDPYWAKNIWKKAEIVEFESIGDAVKKLKSLGLRWAHYSTSHHRRAELIAEGVRASHPQLWEFGGAPIPTRSLGSFTLTSQTTMIVSAECSQSLPHGELRFVEDQTSAPSRAYLKLWEALTRLGVRPQPGDHCIDLGSCPGGWTWVLAQLKTQVVSVDRAPIDPKVLALPGVTFVQGNAFTQSPKSFSRMDWVFSDVICEPQRLLELVTVWIAAHPEAKFVCSVKFRGGTDFETLDRLQSIPDTQILHLLHNKNEVTWIRMPKRA